MTEVVKYRAPLIAYKWKGGIDKHPAIQTLSDNSDIGWVWSRNRRSITISVGDWLVYDPEREIYDVFKEEQYRKLFEKTEEK